MLQAMRSGIGSWFVKIFLGLLVMSFAIWGVGDMFRTAIDTSVAVVGKTKITDFDFTREFNQQLQLLRSQFGGRMDTETALQLGLADTVVNRMVSRAALDHAASDLGLMIPDSHVVREIQSNPAFHNQFGDFDRISFSQILYRMQLSEPQFVEMTRGDIARTELINSLVAGATAPKSLIDALYSHRNEKRGAEFFIIRNSDIKDIGEPDEGALVAYHQDHAENFTAPEYRTVSFITVEVGDLTADIEIGDKEMRSEYIIRADEFGTPEMRKVEQIVIADMEEARELYRKIEGGLDFAQAAFERDGSTLDDILLGTLDRVELAEAADETVANVVFALAADAVSEPVETPFGWHIFRVDEIIAGQSRDFEDVVVELRERLTLERATDELYDFANRIDDELAGGASLEDVATTTALRLRTLAPFDRGGRDGNGNQVSGLPRASKFLGAAFDKEIGEDLYLDETDEEGYFVIRLDDIRPRTLKPLDEVREAVVVAWRAEQGDNAARERADKMIEVAAQGGDFAALAEGLGRKVEKAKSFDRNGVGARPAMSRALIVRIFESDSGYAIAPTIDNDGYIVARITNITPGDPRSDEAGLRVVGQNVSRGLGDDVLAQYQAALHRELGIRINRALMMRLFDPSAGGLAPTLPR